MKLLHPSLLACILTLPSTLAQEEIDPVQEAIRKFETSRSKKPAEVTVTLDPPATTPAPTEAPDPAADPDSPTETTEPPPTPEPPSENPTPNPESPTPPTTPPSPATKSPPPHVPDLPKPDPTPQPTPPTEPPATTPPPAGVSVSVRKLESGGQPLDTSTLKVLAPFPAKPLSQAPKGWLIEPSDNIPPYSQQVELEPGKTITLNVKPHVMVPDADGVQTFMVPEPGYNPALEYQQNATIGAVLAGSLHQLDADSKQLGTALDQLQQLLISLPKPKARPVSEP